MDENQVVGALKHLEGARGSSPSTKEIAEMAGCSEATAIKYLQKAVKLKLIVQRNGKYMTHTVARAYDSQKK